MPPPIPLSDEQAIVDEFIAKAMMLIQMVADYGAAGVTNPDAERNLRQLRITTAALNAAFSSLPMIMMPPVSPVVTAMPLTTPPGGTPPMPQVARPGPQDMLPRRP